jgi:ketosteroid isomerase-like protein
MPYLAVEQAIEASHDALGAIIRGDFTPWLDVYSDSDDISIGNPFGPFATGRRAMAEAGARAAGHYSNGIIHGFDRIATHLSDTLACVVEVERFEVCLDRAREPTALNFRVTSVFRRETNGWKLVHRHADPVNSIRTAEALTTS